MTKYLKILILVLISKNALAIISHTKAPNVTANVDNYTCRKFSKSENYTEFCSMKITMNPNPDVDWKKIACFGELKFKQLFNGKIEDENQGFLVSANQNSFKWPSVFEVMNYVYFPVNYQAIDPKLDWIKCEIIQP
ncbi:MAG: hypothetical protein HAW67_00790 [Endozoicomonadaceae bacterium]|nr:hypothetical protein [Endozoicomonadaceae bacterium]